MGGTLMRIISKRHLYIGNLYFCYSCPTVASTMFGIPYKAEIVKRNLIFVKLKDGTFIKLIDYKKYGKKATRYSRKARSGENFVSNLKPYNKENDMSR